MFRLAQWAFRSGEFEPLTPDEENWLVSRYPRASPTQRVRLRCRIASVVDVLRAVDRFLPPHGSFLDAGCGYGFVSHWLAREPARRVLGVDVSPAAVRVAEASLRPQNLDFGVADARKALDDETRWDGVICVDTLLYFDAAAQIEFVNRVRDRAGTAGWFVIRDSAREPAWKHRWTHFEERLKLRAWRYGARDARLSLTYRSLDEWRPILEGASWSIRLMSRCGRCTPYPGWFGVCQADGYGTPI